MNLSRIEGRFSPTEDGKCSVSEKGMVTTAFPEATQAGVELLAGGGNAVDAACAAALALGVCEPQASGLGGQGMVILHVNGKIIGLDGSSRVPSLAHITRMKGNHGSIGYQATTVPSTPALLGYLHFHYGRVGWKEVLAPAIRIARRGYAITPLQHQLQVRQLAKFQEVDSLSGARYFLKDGREPYAAGDRFVQEDLAGLLEFLAENGVKAFYTGDPAKAIDRDMREHEGFLRFDDLALIPWPVVRKPIHRSYRRLKVYALPPPAGGRTLLLSLLMLRNLPSKFLRKKSPESYHFLAEIFRKALINRRERPFEANLYRQLPHDKVILSLAYANMLAHSIQDKIDPALPLVELYPEDQDTTHLSVWDADGTAVGITQSIEQVYGSHAAARGMGFLYNNYMGSLETEDPTHPYYLRPNAVPWSSVAPVIAVCNKQPWMVAGSPGSDRIFSTMCQFISNVADGNMPLSEAMLQPRIHCTIGGNISYESGRFDPAIVDYLKRVGYKLTPREPFAFYLGAIHAVIKPQTCSGFQGVAEMRRDGTAAGP